MEEDSRLIDEVKKREKGAFESLVRKYKGTVFNTAYSIIGNTEKAEDITQEVFLKVYTRIGQFKGKSPFSTWLYRVTVNASIDELRRKERKTLSLDSLNAEEAKTLEELLTNNEPDIVTQWERRELDNMVQKVLNSLPDKDRIILVLKEIENLSYREISQVMGISIAKVKVRLFRARQRLKQKLSCLLQEPRP